MYDYLILQSTEGGELSQTLARRGVSDNGYIHIFARISPSNSVSATIIYNICRFQSLIQSMKDTVDNCIMLSCVAACRLTRSVIWRKVANV